MVGFNNRGLSDSKDGLLSLSLSLSRSVPSNVKSRKWCTAQRRIRMSGLDIMCTRRSHFPAIVSATSIALVIIQVRRFLLLLSLYSLLLVVTLDLVTGHSGTPDPGNHHHVIKTCTPGTNNTAAFDECRYYLLLKKRTVAREVVDPDSISVLGINITAVEAISKETLNSHYAIGEPVPILKAKSYAPDDIVDAEMLKLSILQETLIDDVAGFGPFVNPAVVLFHNRLLLCTALSWGGTHGLKGPASDHIEFRWINHTYFPFDDSEPYFGVLTNTTESIPMSDRYNEKEILLGQDPRLLVLNNRSILVAYTNRYAVPLKMGIAIISISALNELTVTENYIGVLPNEDAYAPQKNWTPFMYNNTLHFVQHFVPFTIATIDTSQDPTSFMNNDKWTAIFTKQVHVHEGVHLPWHYGSLRGGTNTVLIDDIPGKPSFYLTLFHSSTHLTGNSLKTYFMGALAFSASPPFTPLAMSPYPIVHHLLYSGTWAIFKQRRMDYVVFPMGLSRVGNTLYLSLGHQDFWGVMCKLNVSSVVESLRPLQHPI
jgi:predicted GH43/DUF377 family glycosyl hydrolase